MLLVFLVFSDIPSPIGASAAIVPTEVPIDTDIKHPIINNPVTKRFDGSIDKLKFTVESTPPIALATLENAPASKNIITIKIILESPAPLQNIFIFSSKLTFLLNNNANPPAIKNATNDGIL